MVSRAEIEEDLKNKGDFVKIDHLNRYLKQADSIDVKKFILMKLVEIYIDKGFYLDAAKRLDIAADASITFKEKLDAYMKEAELLVKSHQFSMADQALKKALVQAGNNEKNVCYDKYISYYEAEALVNEKSQKHRTAIDFYEKIHPMARTRDKREIIRTKIISLYGKLGMVKDQNRWGNRVEPKIELPNKSIEPGSFEDLGIRKI